MRLALTGLDVTPLLAADARQALPVRLALPPEQRSNLDAALRLTVTAQDGRAIPLSELVQVRQETLDAVYFHKDLLPVSYVFGDMAGQLDSPLYGLFAMREDIAKLPMPHGAKLDEYFISQPADPYRSYAIKWDGEWQITYETFRDMGLAYAVGLVLIYLLVVAQFGSYLRAAGHHGADSADGDWRDAWARAAGGAVHRHFSMIGMIALAGIIVRNSILLVDLCAPANSHAGVPMAQRRGCRCRGHAHPAHRADRAWRP
jgi:multidrug efflux pump subunit AcrB